MEMIVKDAKLQSGYKQTEIGVIPKDWETKTFGEVMTGFTSGATPSRTQPDFYKGNIRWITSGELNYNVIMDTIEKISVEAASKTNLKLIPKGTFLIAITGMEAEGTRGSCGIVGAEATTNQHCMALFPTKDLSTHYLFHYYVFKGKSLALQYCQGTKQQDYTARIVKLLPIVIPPPPEQQAIATTLSDVDALITSLDKLIAKKRDIKLATMQQLLTGRTRLPGFSEEWEVRKLGDVSAIKTGKKNNEEKVENGTYPFFVRSQTIERINTYSFDGEAILVPGEGGIGSIIHYINGKFDYHQRVYKISDFSNDIYGKFVYFSMLQNFNNHAIHNSVKATVDSLRLPTFQEFEFLVPAFKEQQAIATVLSDMDAEIVALEQRRDKARALKQGMMQELLTGKTRLL